MDPASALPGSHLIPREIESNQPSTLVKWLRIYFISEIVLGSLILLSEIVAFIIVIRSIESPDDEDEVGDSSYNHNGVKTLSNIENIQVKDKNFTDVIVDWLEPDTKGHMNRLRYLIFVQIITFGCQLMIQVAAVRYNAKSFFVLLFFPIILNMFLSAALCFLQLPLFYFFTSLAVIDFIICSVIVKNLY